MHPAPPRDIIVHRIAAIEAGGPGAGAEAARGAGPRVAKRGNNNPISQSLEAVLAARDPGVIGAVADLAYVEDDALCRAASWHVGSRMLMCVVRDRATLETRRAALREGRWRNLPICAFLALDMAPLANSQSIALDQLLNRYAVPGEPRAFAQKRAAWVRAACDGTVDPPVGLLLPHNSGPQRNSGAGAALEKGLGTGLIGHLVNLVRPAVAGHRRSVLWAAMQDTLLFDTLQNAMAYKAAMVRANARCPALLSLECERVTSNGITEGGKPPGPKVTDLEAYFGGAPAGDADEELAALRALLAETETLAQAEEDMRRAEAAAAGGEAAPVRAGKRAAAAAADDGGEDMSDADDEEPQHHGRKSGCVCAAPVCLRACCRALTPLPCAARRPSGAGARRSQSRPSRSKSRATRAETLLFDKSVPHAARGRDSVCFFSAPMSHRARVGGVSTSATRARSSPPQACAVLSNGSGGHREGAAGQGRARHHHCGGGRRRRGAAPRAGAGSRGPAVAPGARARHAFLAPRCQPRRLRALRCRAFVADSAFHQYVHHQQGAVAMGAPVLPFAAGPVVVEQRVVGKKLKPEGWLAVCVLAFVFWPLMCVPCCIPACQEDVVETVYIAVSTHARLLLLLKQS